MSEGKEADKQRTQPLEAIGGFIMFLCILGLPAWVVWRITPNSIRYPALYGALYQVGPHHVFVRRQPADCDWGHAPIGDKDCQYRKQVLTHRDAAGRVIEVLVAWEKVPD